MDIRRRQMGEQLGLQHARHPVAIVLVTGLELVDLHGAIAAGAVGGQQAVDEVACDAHHADFGLGPRGHLARLQLRYRMGGGGRATGQTLYYLATTAQFQPTFKQID